MIENFVFHTSITVLDNVLIMKAKLFQLLLKMARTKGISSCYFTAPISDRLHH